MKPTQDDVNKTVTALMREMLDKIGVMQDRLERLEREFYNIYLACWIFISIAFIVIMIGIVVWGRR